MGKPGVTKMVNLGPKQKYGLKMDHGVKQEVPKMKPRPAVTGNIQGEPEAVGTTNWIGYHDQQTSSNPREVVKRQKMQTKDVRLRGVNQMSKTDKGINYMMGAATKQYGGKMEGAMKKGCYGAKQMKTGLYQDRMDGKLPQNPMLMQYGMSDKAVKQVGKHMAMPQMDGDDKKIKAKKQDYGMTGYNASEFTNQSTGEGLKVFKPQSRTIGGKTKYSYTKPSGEIQDITQEQYTKKLQSGSFKRTQNKDVIGGRG